MMNASIGDTIREWVPPAVMNLLRARFGSFRFQGDFPSWQAAVRECEGYSSDGILARVKTASLAVEDGKAAFERDSVLFDRIEYSWPLLAGLLWIAAQRKNRLHVLDFGGSLGSSYRQNRRFLTGLERLNWSVVEQPSFAACGKRNFENDVLWFFPDLDGCLAFGRPDVAIFSSVLQYVERPYQVLKDVLATGVGFLIIDRTPFIEGPRDRLSVQTVTGRIFPASYPAWFFSRRQFLDSLETHFELVEEFDASDRPANVACRYLGLLMRRRPVVGAGS
jgi:putative methyltransferase (TIGR04325 family)